MISTIAPELEIPPQPAKRQVQITATTKQKPPIVDQLNDWQYLERTAHRLLAAWGRHMADWEGKSAIHRHVWDQAECVRRLRDRIEEFPGGKADASVSPRLEAVANALLFAPSFDDALDGIYLFLLKASMAAYVDYTSKAHPIHDAPTAAVLHEVNQIKSQQWLWYRDYRRQHPHSTDADYEAKVLGQIKACGGFTQPLPVSPGEVARLCGLESDFQLPKYNARTQPVKPREDFMGFVSADFTTSLEARRLFWAYGYMMEKNLPDEQLAWLYYGHEMPWAWHHDISRHLWDESRHGDSGYSRLKDFGITLEEVGFPPYNLAEGSAVPAAGTEGKSTALDMSLPMTPMSAKDLYEAVYFIGMVAETGHFIVKNEAYQDFKEGQDFESAEMMIFDIIDETVHVQYAHRWLPLLAEKAGLDNSGYRERAAREREEKQQGQNAGLAAAQLDRSDANPAYRFYQDLLGRIRASYPLTNAETCPVRSPKPM